MKVTYLTGLILAASVLATGCKKEAPATPTQPTQVEAPPVEGVVAPVVASEAKIEIIEFSDFECPFCSRVNPTLDQLKKELGGSLKVSFMHQPLPFHKNARGAAIAAEAARRQGKFQEMHDKMFANQKALGTAELEKYATEIGLDLAKYKADIADATLDTVVNQHQAIANAVGATGTPAFFINGVNLKGAQPYEKFKEVVDAELAAAGDKKGDAFIQERLKANNENLYNFVYGGKTPPENVPRKAPVDKTVYKVDVDNKVDAIKGAPDALITMVVFSEFECPFCSKVEPTLNQLMTDYDGKIRTVFKHSPLPFHKHAVGASTAALCAQEQGKFWEMHDKMFANQKALAPENLVQYATDIGLDLAKYNECFAAPCHDVRIKVDMDLAGKVTARGTPNIFINGRKLQGAKPIEEFKEIIDEELTKAQALVAKGIPAADVYTEVVKDGRVFEPLEEKVNEFNLEASALKGDKNAKIQIVEFSDFQCPFCSRVGAPLIALKEKYGDDLVIAFKHFPLDFHKEAKPAALGSMCANDQGKFWEFHDQVFANQKALSNDDLKTYATTIGVDVAKWEACIAAGTHNALIEAEMAEGRKAGVRGTPTVFINGRRFTAPGGYTVEAFSSVIDKYILGK